MQVKLLLADFTQLAMLCCMLSFRLGGRLCAFSVQFGHVSWLLLARLTSGLGVWFFCFLFVFFLMIKYPGIR